MTMNLQEIKPLLSNEKKKVLKNRLIPLGAERNVGYNRILKKNRKSYIFHYFALDRSFMYYFYVLELKY